MTGEYRIKAEESGERIDALLARSIEGLSRSAAQRLLDSGMVRLGGVALRKSYRTVAGECYDVRRPEAVETELLPEDIALDVVFEDEDVIVVNKPRGLVVHPAPGHESGTLVNALLRHCGDSLSGIGGEKRPGIVHRIDKDTSGLIIAAKNDAAHLALSAQLADHSLARVYDAIVLGRMREDAGTVCAPIGRSPAHRKKMAVTDKNSRPAVTHWQVTARYNGFTRLRCQLETGRTHQIRVHMAYIGHPLLGDSTYGGTRALQKGAEGQILHAGEIRFTHPRTEALITLKAPTPEYFQAVVDKLGVEVG